MLYLPLTLFCLSILSHLALALSPGYLPCQLQKPAGEPALAGCPEGAIYVSPTDSNANFSSVQEAIDSLPETGKAVILIGEGQYYEMVNVTRCAPLVLLGQLDSATASLRAGNASQRNLVHIWSDRYSSEGGYTDEETATLTVAPSLGYSFGNVDFKAYNINFENRAANYSIGPALAISTALSNSSFYGCSISSWQDTMYIGDGANAYTTDSIIYGQTDYLFGFGISWVQSSTVANRACGGGITAWRGTAGANNGIYIVNSTIIRSPDADQTTMTNGGCFLGRPWNELAVGVFLHNHMDDSIHPHGFTAWDQGGSLPSTTFYAEFGSYGAGGNMSARVSQDHILNPEEAKKYRLKHVFHETPKWIDFGYHHH